MKGNNNSRKVVYSKHHQNIFCEHLVRFGLSPTISRLEFGSLDNLDSEETMAVELTLKIPTFSLLSAIPTLYKDLEDEDFKKQLITDLKNVIEQLEDS